MAKFLENAIEEQLQDRTDKFNNKISSEMHFESNFSSDIISFEWVDEIEQACPYIDNIVRHPKLTLIREENVVKVEKSKKITVASVKDLSRHTNYIAKVNKKTNDVEPSKILDIRNEETFDIYENRFLYTLIDLMTKFIMKKEEQLNNFEINDNKVLEYAANSITDKEKVNIEIKITTSELPKEKNDKKIQEEINSIKARVKRIKDYLGSWQKSEMVKALDKAHVPFILPPIKKTNIILKNPNFQIAVKLWGFLNTYDYTDRDNSKEILDSDGDEQSKNFLDHSFLINYYVLDSISKSKREQKEKLAKYSVLMLAEEINRTMSLLISSGIDISEEELLKMVAKELKNNKGTRLVGADDVKKKFKNAMDEYFERMQDYL